MNFNIDIAIFVGFLVTNLVLGLYSSRGIRTIKEYAIGDRNFSTATIAATIVATWVSGATFSITTSETYREGLYFVIPGLGDALSFFIISYFCAPRMAEFLGKLSIAEAMGSLYGKNIRLITAISGIFPAIGNVAAQFTILAALLNHWLGIPGIYAIAISSFVVITYSTFGGIKAVTFTDLIQFFTFGTIIPVIAFIIWNQFSDTEAVFSTLMQNPLFDYRAVIDHNNPKFLDTLFLFLFFMIPGFDSAIFQRISMSRNTYQVSKSFIIAGCFIIVCDQIINTFIGTMLGVNDIADLSATNVVGYIMDNYLTTGFKGLFVISIMAMIMSTADSYINSSSVLFAYDFCKSIGITLSKQKELLLARITSLLIGMTALFLSLFSKNLLDLMLSTYSFYMPIVSVPFLLAIFGFRSTSKAVLIGMGAGFVTVILFKLFSDINSLMPGMIANVVFFMGSHYLLHEQGGWTGIIDKTHLEEIRLARRKKWESYIYWLKSFSLVRFCRQNYPKEEKFYVYFGLFNIVSIFSCLYSLPNDIYVQYQSIINYLHYSILTISTIFITYPIWLTKFKNETFIAIIWSIALFFCLVFSNSLLFIFSEFNQTILTIMMTNLVTLAILLRWQTAMFMMFIGVLSSVEFYKWYSATDNLSQDISSNFKITYALIAISSILIAFLKPKQEYLEATEKKVGVLETEVTHLGHEVTDLSQQVTHYSERVADQAKEIERLGATAQKILNNVNHELRLPIGNVVNFSDMLYEALQKTDNKLVKELSREVYDNSNRISTMILNMLDLATLDVKKVDLKKTMINFSELVMDQVKTYRKIYLRDKKIDFELTIEPEIMISVDPNYLRQTVGNLVINAISFSEKGLIKVSVVREKNMVIFTISDRGKGIPKPELSDIFTPFKMGSNTESKAKGRGVGLALCKSAVEAHGGTIRAHSDGICGATLRFTLPLSL